MRDRCYLTPPSKGFGGNAALSGPVRPRRRTPPNNTLTEIPVTLVCVDTTDRVDLASRAISECLTQGRFAAVKLLTHDMRYPHAVKIPRLQGMAGYSKFMIRELANYVDTSHALVVQWDGYVCDGSRWQPSFLSYDYIGPPWWQWYGLVGNGGFSLRSKKLLDLLARTDFHDNEHPEDTYICMRNKDALVSMGIQFAPTAVAGQFAIESRTFDRQTKVWHGSPLYWNDHFGFHSWLTPLPNDMPKPMIFHHGGDFGDVIYALPTIQALGGGVLFLSPDNRHPYPQKPRGDISSAWVDNIKPLLDQQPYIWQALHTGWLPFSVDFDLNAFRDYYRTANPDNWRSILQLHLRRFGMTYDERKPWLRVDRPHVVPGRPIVVNRTQRYQNDQFPWGDLVDRYGDKMIFVGATHEHELFKGFSPHKPVPRLETGNMLDLARVIAGAKVFIGNQSSPMAIALGLGKNLIQEVWLENANCQLARDNAIYWTKGSLEIPQHWLK